MCFIDVAALKVDGLGEGRGGWLEHAALTHPGSSSGGRAIERHFFALRRIPYDRLCGFGIVKRAFAHIATGGLGRELS